MWRIYVILMSLCSLLVSGCSHEVAVPVDELPSLNTPAGLVKELVEKNTFIDVDVKRLVNAATNPKSRSSVNGDDIAKMKAAVYRFYSNVKIKDGYYVCDVPDGAAINISESVFTALKENLDEMNSALKEAKENGHEVKIFEPDSVYLNSLLQ